MALMGRQRVTIRDVAQAAGVSTTTVSHVLSGNGRVRAQTREQVQQQVRLLGYQPNPLAANLRRSTFGSVGLVLPPVSLNFTFYSELMIGASEVLLDASIGLSLIPPATSVDQLTELAIDAVIIAEPRSNDDVLQRLREHRTPAVFCEAPDEPLPDDMWAIDSDTTASIGATLDHLRAAGAERIAAVTVDPVLWWGRNVAHAVDVWANLNDRDVRRAIIPFAVPPAQARDQIRELLEDGWADGLLVCHEGLSASALASAQRLGRRVPDDLLIASSVDAPDLLALETSVTALDLQPREIGRTAARLLLERPTEGTRTVIPQLRVRASTTR